MRDDPLDASFRSWGVLIASGAWLFLGILVFPKLLPPALGYAIFVIPSLLACGLYSLWVIGIAAGQVFSAKNKHIVERVLNLGSALIFAGPVLLLTLFIAIFGHLGLSV